MAWNALTADATVPLKCLHRCRRCDSLSDIWIWHSALETILLISSLKIHSFGITFMKVWNHMSMEMTLNIWLLKLLEQTWSNEWYERVLINYWGNWWILIKILIYTNKRDFPEWVSEVQISITWMYLYQFAAKKCQLSFVQIGQNTNWLDCKNSNHKRERKHINQLKQQLQST